MSIWGSRHKGIQGGTVVITANLSSGDAIFDEAYSDTDYVVTIECPYQTSWWITNKTTTGFTLNVGTLDGYDQTFGYLAYHL